jgi:carbamoyl-phosphate synthase large subunit
MPKRTDIQSILIVGAGPIVIGQACEFDYSGTQACKALRDEGYRIILVNSNPATIMTDPEMADATYVEPITPEIVAQILEKERPDAILPTMGGQTALNTTLALHDNGTLERLGVEMIGADAAAIEMAEDREKFRAAMDRIGLENPRASIAASPEIRDEAGKLIGYDRITGFKRAMDALDDIGLPAIIRPAFTLGGTGGGVAYNREEFETIVRSGLDASPTGQVLIDESLLGWKEFEMEVVRDKADNCIIICSIENVDPMGVHTGDSITVAPALTLTDREYQVMRNASIAVLREIGVETGGSNVQFAVNPENGRLVVIEMNPRVSRSSALASKATGFPIAKVAAKLAVGFTLDELANDITGGATPASFEPTIDYVVTKIPRFAFEKFPGSDPSLTTAMKSVGEVMAIGRTFHESLQKALRSMENGLTGLDDAPIDGLGQGDDKNILRGALANPTPDRILKVAEALRRGMPQDQVQMFCKYDPWFIARIAEIVAMEQRVIVHGLPEDADNLRALKAMGFSDARLAALATRGGRTTREADVAALRGTLDVQAVHKRIDTCAAEFASPTAYMYSTYETGLIGPAESEAKPSDKEKIVILGGGPNRIGQGIEFDYCCCHACFSLSAAGFETIMVNCNPETVSTDYDTSDRLYFEPLTAEDVIGLIRTEQTNGTVKGVIVQFGGQTPLKLAAALEEAGIPILGTPPDAIDLAEDRDRFNALIERLDLRQPESGIARSPSEAREIAERIGFPVVIRPSYVLGGRAMEIVHDTDEVNRYVTRLSATLDRPSELTVSDRQPLLIDRYLTGATEVDVDCLSDGEDTFIAGVMEHIEEAGIHSGDSACALPPHSLSAETIAELEAQASQLAKALGVVGLMNIQFAIKNGEIYILEVNPRASRTVPFVAKVVGLPVAGIAAEIMSGRKLASFALTAHNIQHIAVKEAVFPFARFPGVDPVLGPEMRSTGEVMGIDTDFAVAFAKSQIGAGQRLPDSGTVFISVRDEDKSGIVGPSRELISAGFDLIATRGTARYLISHGLECGVINKVLEGRPHIVDAMKNGDVSMVFNTTDGAKALADSKDIRRTALLNHIPYYTTLAGAVAVTRAIAALKAGSLTVAPLQDYAKRAAV